MKLKINNVFSRFFVLMALISAIIINVFVPNASCEEFEFQTKVQNMMNILIESLYNTKEIFLRELISNASDAIEKMRVHSITNPEDLQLNGQNFNVTIHSDFKNKRLIIQDNGIGMTRADLIENLGTLAKSGTADFMARLKEQKSKDSNADPAKDGSNLIGQFGVGFYSVFLVAEKVEVHTKHPSDKQYVWTSSANTKFDIEEANNPEVVIDHGTRIVIHLKPEMSDKFSNTNRLSKWIHQYSEFITVPIYLNTTRTEKVPKPETEEEKAIRKAAEERRDARRKEKELAKQEKEKKKAEKAAKAAEKAASGESDDAAAAADDEDDEDEKDTEKDEEEEEIKPPPMITKRIYELKHINDKQPIWMRPKSSVTKEEYNKFFKDVFKEYSDPLRTIFFQGEGDVNFRCLVFIPSRPKHSALHITPEKYAKNLRVYVKRVFITDVLLDFLPRHLAFIRGIIESEDFDLNVSRESLQKNNVLPKVKSILANKALSTIEEMAKNETEYKNFYNNYGSYIKMGIMDSKSAKEKLRLTKLLRYPSTFNETNDATVSFDDYVKRMRQNQTAIYYITGSSSKSLRNSPYIEKAVKRGYEVLLMDDGLDDYMMQRLTSFGKIKVQDVARGDMKFGDESAVEKEDYDRVVDKFKPLTKWMTTLLNHTIDSTIISKRLTKSACALVANEGGWTGRMRSIMMSQKDDMMSSYYLSQKSKLEINPDHPVILALLAKVEADAVDKDVEDLAHSLLDSALIMGDYPIQDVQKLVQRIENAVRLGLGVDMTSQAQVDIKPAPAVDESIQEPSESDVNENEADPSMMMGNEDFDEFEDHENDKFEEADIEETIDSSKKKEETEKIDLNPSGDVDDPSLQDETTEETVHDTENGSEASENLKDEL